MALFVTFEGIEGSGKSTHLRLLADHLRAAGHPVVETREPGGTAAGAAIRRLLLGTDAPPLSPLSELLLYCADRTEHVSIVIRPALAAGQVVLSDRFSESTIAYQSYGRGLDLTVVRTLDAHARAGLVPHLTFLLDCPASEGLRRIAGRHASAAPLPLDRFERETLAFHERVRDGFRTLAAAEPTRFCVIDASAPVETIRARIAAEADRRLAKAA